MTLDDAIRQMELAVWEMGEVFGGLSDEAVWARSHPRLWSVGELAAHTVYGTRRWLMPTLQSPLLYDEVRYYFYLAETPMRLDLGAAAVYEEVKRAHEEVAAHLRALQPDLNAPCPNVDGMTWTQALDYIAFHLAYHTGQMMSVRHLIGHETPDN